MSENPFEPAPETQSSGSEKPLRSLFAAVCVVGMVVLKFVPDWIENGPSMTWAIGAFGPVLLGLALILWWLFFSRAHRSEKFLGLAGVVVLMVFVGFFAHYSIQDPPSMMAIVWPLVVAGFGIGAVLFGSRKSDLRPWLMLGVASVAMLLTLMLRTDGVMGDFRPDLKWRWEPTAEDEFLAERATGEDKLSDVEAIQLRRALQDPQWPQFRGPEGNSVQQGVKFAGDWLKTPKELWRHRVGPAWSSFAVAGDFLFTQEQRGESEAVVCYNAEDGSEVWATEFESRFFESLGGLGPRSTPTLAGNFVYVQGAERWLAKLNAVTGEVEWKVDLLKAAKRTSPPGWGFSASPLVHNGLVYVHSGEPKEDLGMLAFDIRDGSLKWTAPAGSMSYCSPQILTILGRETLVMLTNAGAHLFDPSSGEQWLDYEWEHLGYRANQAQVVGGDQLLIPTGMGSGTRLLQLKLADSKLEAEEIWTSLSLKPDFNDVVIFENAVYGFDQGMLAAIDLESGDRLWKGGRYGKGQMLLLSDSGLLLVAGERGELAIVRATPDDFEEIFRWDALTGKTWNHPVVVSDRLYLRNAEEMVCYQLPVAD